MDSKHILIIPSWYPATFNDVGGSFFREQAIALKKRGYKVGVIAPSFRSIRDIKGVFLKKYGISYEVDNGINTYRYHSISFPKMPRLANKRWVSAGWKLYKEYIKKHGVPDIIHVHSIINGGFLAYEIYKKYYVKYVITEHSSFFSLGKVSKHILKNISLISSESKYNIAVSDRFKELLNGLTGVERWVYIPNIVENGFLTYEGNIKRDAFNFITVSLLTRNKRVDVILKAFAKSFKGDSRVFLKIGGDGPERPYLEALAKKMSIQNQVFFLGMLSREQVKAEVAAADAFMLSSEYETFGVVVIEALALGKPVIATKSGGPESILNDEVGYLVDVNDVEQMSEAMIDLYKNIDRFDAEYIRSYCRNNFSEDAVISKLSSIYQSVVESN